MKCYQVSILIITALCSGLAGCSSSTEICVPEHRQCNGNVVEQCNAEGKAWVFYRDCEAKTCRHGDCVVVPDSCGQGGCEAALGETCSTCPEDCGDCCGNGQCEESYFESYFNCPQDCPPPTDGGGPLSDQGATGSDAGVGDGSPEDTIPGTDTMTPPGGCPAGSTQCSQDGFGMHMCGFDGSSTSFGPRIPCDPSDSCSSNVCQDSACNQPEVMLALDRSSSMLTDDRWSWVSTTLLDLVQSKQSTVHFGIRHFPTTGCQVSNPVTPALNAHSTVAQQVITPTTNASTPLSQALDGLDGVFGDPNVAQVVVLITDGDETCATGQQAVEAAGALFRAGVYVHAIGVTTQANVTLLDKIALAGGTQQAVIVNDGSSLQQALEGVLMQHNTCCAPACTGKACGSDGCGGSCGGCAVNEVCNSSGQCELSPDAPWAVRLGSSNNDGASGAAVDPSGNLLLCGDFDSGTVIGSTSLTSKGGVDGLVVKISPTGEVLWARNLGGSGEDRAMGVATDAQGNVYVTGYFEYTGYFGNTMKQSKGKDDLFLAKLSPDGDVLWAVGAGGPENDRSNAVAVDGSGNAWITGSFSGTASFGSQTLSAGSSSDVLLARVSSSGSITQAAQAGSYGSDRGLAVAVDSAGTVFVGGAFHWEITFGSTFLDSIDSSVGDGFVAAYSPTTGQFINAGHVEGLGLEYVNGLAAVAPGEVLIVGDYSASTVQVGSQTLGTNGATDIFVARWSSTSNSFSWATGAGGLLVDYGKGITVDGQGKAYLTGKVNRPTTIGTSTLGGSGDAVLAAEVSASGSLGWAKAAGGDHFIDKGTAIAADNKGHLYVVGEVGPNAVDIDGTTLSAKGGWDIFVWKIVP